MTPRTILITSGCRPSGPSAGRPRRSGARTSARRGGYLQYPRQSWSGLGQVQAVPVGVRAMDVDDPLQPRLLQEARRDPSPVAGGAVDGHRRLARYFLSSERDVGDINMHRARDVSARPLVLVASVDHGHRLRAENP